MGCGIDGPKALAAAAVISKKYPMWYVENTQLALANASERY
jgi:hypothetical protein